MKCKIKETDVYVCVLRWPLFESETDAADEYERVRHLHADNISWCKTIDFNGGTMFTCFGHSEFEIHRKTLGEISTMPNLCVQWQTRIDIV